MRYIEELDKSKIESLIISILKNLLTQNDVSMVEKITNTTSLIGPKSLLDSLGLVTFLIDIEQQINQDYDLTLTLTNERALSQKNSPFRTIKSLTEYITLLVEEKSENVRS